MLIGAEFQGQVTLKGNYIEEFLRERFGPKFDTNPLEYDYYIGKITRSELLDICIYLLGIPKLLEMPSLGLFSVTPWKPVRDDLGFN